MDPDTKNQKPDTEKDARYAEALVAMANMEYKMDQAKQPQKKRFLSKKKLIYIGVSIILTIVSFLATPALFKDSPEDGLQGKDTTDKLLNSANELKELED